MHHLNTNRSYCIKEKISLISFLRTINYLSKTFTEKRLSLIRSRFSRYRKYYRLKEPLKKVTEIELKLCSCTSSRPEVFYKGVLRNFAKSTGKHLCQSLFFNKAAGLRPVTLLKKRLWLRCFPENFVKFSRHLFHRTPPEDYICKEQLQLTLNESP